MLYFQGDSASQAMLASSRFYSAVSLRNLFFEYHMYNIHTEKHMQSAKIKFLNEMKNDVLMSSQFALHYRMCCYRIAYVQKIVFPIQICIHNKYIVE